YTPAGPPGGVPGNAVAGGGGPYGNGPAGAIMPAGAPVPRPAAAEGKVGALTRRARGAWEVVRPFSFTASLLPVAVGGAIALGQGRMHWSLFLAALFGGLGLHVGTNVINEI